MLYKKFSLIALTLGLSLSLSADQRPSFVFSGKQLYIGMTESEVTELLEDCCKISPPLTNQTEKNPLTPGAGQFIIKKDEPLILGGIYFENHRVRRLTKPVAEDVDFSNDELVAFTRDLKRILRRDSGEAGRRATIYVYQQKATNAEGDKIVINCDDGHGLEITVGTLDKPNEATNKRDFITADETLEGPR